MCKYWHNVGAWRSLVARLFRVQEAVSSNLAAPTKLKIENRYLWRFFFYAPAVLLFWQCSRSFFCMQYTWVKSEFISFSNHILQITIY